MKKVLFATTALVATAGVAAADVTFGGYGRFGVLYSEGAADEWSLTSRFRLIVTGTAESDNGLSFGAQVRYQADGHQGSRVSASGVTVTTTTPTTTTLTVVTALSGGGAGFNTPRFWVTSNGFTVSVGNVLGAIENMPNMYTGSIGLTGLGYGNVVYNSGANPWAADAYSSGGSGSQGIDVIWSGGAWGVHLSHSWDDQGNAGRGFDRTGLAVSYAFGNWTLGAGYQDGGTGDTEWVLTSGTNFGNWDVAFNIADNAGGLKYGAAFNYQATASTFIRGYLNHDESVSDEYIGIGVHHRLGGGTFLEGGIADLAGTTRADLGLRFSF